MVGWWRRLLSQSIKKPLTCDHLFPLVGPHAVLVRRVLDFSFHHTDDNSSLGLPLQNVSGSFLCRFLVVFIFTISVLTGHSNLFLNYFINVYFVFFRFRRTFYKTLKEQIQEVEVEHVSSHFPAVAFPSRSPRFFLPGSPRSHIAFTLCSLFFWALLAFTSRSPRSHIALSSRSSRGPCFPRSYIAFSLRLMLYTLFAFVWRPPCFRPMLSSQSHRVVLAFNVLRSLAFFSRSPCSLFIFASQSHRVLLVCFFFVLLALFSRSPCSLRTFASQSHHVRVRFYLLSLHSLCASLAFSRHCYANSLSAKLNAFRYTFMRGTSVFSFVWIVF